MGYKYKREKLVRGNKIVNFLKVLLLDLFSFSLLRILIYSFRLNELGLDKILL